MRKSNEIYYGEIASRLDSNEYEDAYNKITEAREIIDGEQLKEFDNDFIYCLAGFYSDTGHKKLDELMKKSIERINLDEDKSMLYEGLNGKLTGLILSKSPTKGALFLPDVSEPGRVRYSEFDAKGFYTHSTFDDYKDALDSAWSNGFRDKEDPSWFDSLSRTQEWVDGMKQTNEIMRANEGRGSTPYSPRNVRR